MTNPAMTPLATILPLWTILLLSLPLGAESRTWELGHAIDCPLSLSTPTQLATRTIVFPGGAIVDVPVFWDPETQLFVKAIRNTVVLQLRDAQFSATLQIFDDKGNLFLVDVRPAHAGEAVDEVLMLRPHDQAADAGSPPAPDSDGQITQMMAGMVSGRDPSVVGTVVTRVEDGALKVGRHLFADDVLSLDLVKVYQGPHLRGYQCLVRYHGTTSVRLDQQRLWFPGALAVYALPQVLITQASVSIEIRPNQTITLFYVAEQP